jgi:hypothetical protein
MWLAQFRSIIRADLIADDRPFGWALRDQRLPFSQNGLSWTLSVSHSHASSHPRGRLPLHPIQGFKTGFALVNRFNSAIRPLGLYLPMLAIF